MVCALIRRDNPLAKAQGLSLHTGAQTMLYLTCTIISSVDLAHYGVSHTKDWVSVKCGTRQNRTCCAPFYSTMPCSCPHVSHSQCSLVSHVHETHIFFSHFYGRDTFCDFLFASPADKKPSEWSPI